MIVLPKSSRREVKVPLKYRDLEDDEQTSSTPSKHTTTNLQSGLSKPQKQPKSSPTTTVMAAAAAESAVVVVEAEPQPQQPSIGGPVEDKELEQVIADKAQELIGEI